MGRKKLNQNVLINDLEIDENLLTDDENVPVIKQSANLRSRQGKKKAKKSTASTTVAQATSQTKVMKDANLINISDFDSASSDLSDLESDANNELTKKADDATSANEFNLLGDFLTSKKRDDADDEDSETDEFKRNLDLNLKKKKRIFLSSDRTDFLNFILSEQQKINHNSTSFDLASPNQSSNSTKCNTFKLTQLTKPNDNYSDVDDEEDVNSEFNLLLKRNEFTPDTAAEFADDEDDGLTYYFTHNSTKRRLRRFYNYLSSMFKFRPHVETNKLNNYLLNRTNQKPFTSQTSPNEPHSGDELEDLYFDTNQFAAFNSRTSFFRRMSDSFFNLTHYLNSNKRQSNKNSNYFMNKHSKTAEHVELLSDKDGLDQDGWYDGGHEVNVRFAKNQLHLQPESMIFIMVQVFIPFLIAGFGTVGAGLVLDLVQVSLKKSVSFSQFNAFLEFYVLLTLLSLSSALESISEYK